MIWASVNLLLRMSHPLQSRTLQITGRILGGWVKNNYTLENSFQLFVDRNTQYMDQTIQN